MFRNMIVHLDIYYDSLIMDGKLVMSVKSKTVDLTTTESLTMCAFHFFDPSSDHIHTCFV